MARFLIVGGGERATALADDVRREGHAVAAIGDAERLGPLLAALEHVAIVCWLAVEASPERFLLGAVDSSMRGFLYSEAEWEGAVLETAARNSIPTEALRADPDDPKAWLVQARAGIDRLLDGRYAATYG